MDHLVNQLFVFEGDGQVRIFNGNYSDYRNWLEEQEAAPSATTPDRDARQSPMEQTIEKRKATFKEKQEYEKLQEEIDRLEARRIEITSLLNGGGADHTKLQEWSLEIQQINSLIDEKTLRWLALAELIEG